MFDYHRFPSSHHRLPFAILPLALIVLYIGCPKTVQAQQDRGSVAGTVTDSSKAALQGARIEISPSTVAPGANTGGPSAAIPNVISGAKNVTTDQEGNFILSGLTPGHFTLKVSYIGFQSYTTDVDVIVGKVTSIAPVLSVSSSNESVTVRPEREVGEAEALNVQRTSLNVVQVLPSEVINSLPNVNIADAVGRMPSVSVERDEGEAKYVQIRGTEPRLNNVTIDGVQMASPEGIRNVKLDTIPADLVESVQINKTLTANMDGDGIGGSVNLVTREAADQPYFAVEGLYGHTPINGGRGQDQVFATYGRRFLADKKLGALLTGSYDWNGRGINDVEPSQAVNNIVTVNSDGSTTQTGTTVNAPNSIDIRDYFYDRSRYGIGGTLDYRFSDRSTVYLKGLYSYFNDYGEDSINRLNVGNFTSATTTDNSGNVVYQNVYRRPTQNIWNVTLGGQHGFGTSNVNLLVALGQGSITGPFITSQFNGPAATTDANGNNLPDGVGYRFSNQDIFVPKLTPVVTPGNVSIYDPTQYSLSNISFTPGHTFQRNAEGQADYTKSYTQGTAFGSWQIGFKVRDVIKNQISNAFNVSGSGPLLSSFLANRGQGNNYYFGQYQAGPQSKATQILAYYNANQAQFTLDPETATNLQSDFKVNERVYAGYAMNAFTFRRFRVYSGLRVESTNDYARGFQTNVNNDIAPVNLNHSYTFLLPMEPAAMTPVADVRTCSTAPSCVVHPRSWPWPGSGSWPRVRICTRRCRCQINWRRSRFSGLGTQRRGKRSSTSSLSNNRASCRSVFCLRTRAALISAAFPIHSSNFNSASNRSNQRACPVASIPTRTLTRLRSRAR